MKDRMRGKRGSEGWIKRDRWQEAGREREREREREVCRVTERMCV